MSTKTMKILTTIATVLLIVSMGIPVVYGLAPSELKANSTATGTNEVKDFGQNIMGVVQTAGVVIAVVILMVLGIKYMMGSAEEKAEYKKTMIPYLVGAILIFAASTVANVVYQFATGLNGK